MLRDMPLALVTGGARANSIGAAITPRLSADGWDVATSDLTDGEYPCDLATPTARRRWWTPSIGTAGRSVPWS